MRHKWPLLMFSVLSMVSISMMSCSPTLFSPLATEVAPLVDTPVGTPKSISPTVTGTVEPRLLETTIRQWTETPIMSSTPISILIEPALQQAVTQAREDLARRLGVPVDRVTINAVIGQEFSTDAFSCRTSKDRISKDESLQAMSGQSILLSASAHRYEYHASGQTVIFCRPLP
jgi:hypothetical protein